MDGVRRGLAVVLSFAAFATVAGCGGEALGKALVTAGKNGKGVSNVLNSLDNNSFAEAQLRVAFCSAATQIANTGTLSTDWRTWAANQLGLSADAVQEKIDELNAAVTLALNNPQAARAYVKGCKPFSV